MQYFDSRRFDSEVDMSDEEVLPYRAFKKNEDAPVLYWMAYRSGKQGGYAGTAVVTTTLPVFTAATEERLKDMAKELGYGLEPDTIR
jgi:hypothetical protein